MTRTDDRIREALSADDEAFLNELEHSGLFEQLGETFHGPLKVWTAIAFVFTFVLTGAAFYGVYQLFTVETTRLLILWGVFVVVVFHGISMLKMWLFNRMNHLGVLRELKAIQLQLIRKDGAA